MKIWILFAKDGDDEYVNMVFDSEEKAEIAKESREAEDSDMEYRIDWFEVK